MGAEELIAACREAPDDDAPRLVWADSVGGERGELVVLQCDLARLPVVEAGDRWRRVRELVEQHGRAWSGLDEIARSGTWRRGFVERITVNLETCVQRVVDIARLAPLVGTIEVAGVQRARRRHKGWRQPPDPLELVAELLARPELRSVRGLVFHNGVAQYDQPADDQSRGDAIARLLAETGRLAELRELGFVECGLGVEGMRTIAEHGRALQRLQVREDFSITDVDDLYARLLPSPPPLEAIRTLPLRALELRMFDGETVANLPASLVELEVDHAGPAEFAALAASPLATQLEQLRCVYGTIPAASFAAFTRLRPRPLDTITVELTGPRG